LIACFFPGLRCGRKIARARTLHGTKEQEFVALSLAPVQCRSDSPTPAKCVACSTRPCFVPFPQVGPFRRGMIYSSIPYLPNGPRSKTSGKQGTLSLSKGIMCKGIALRKSSFNAGSGALRPTAAVRESAEKRGFSDRHLPVLHP